MFHFPVPGDPAQIINTYQPAGKNQEFFQALTKYKGLARRQQTIKKSYTSERM
jgi:hypothetical protein